MADVALLFEGSVIFQENANKVPGLDEETIIKGKGTP